MAKKNIQKILKNFFKNNDENCFDVDKSTNYILSKYDIVYSPKQGYLLFNNKYWEYVESEYIGKLISEEMDCFTKPNYIKQILQQIKYKRYIELSSINNNRNRIVLPNGTLDISNWEKPVFYENQFYRDNFSTIHFNYKYNPNAEYPNFLKYLNTTFEGQPDNIKIIQEMFGYCLTTSTKHEKIFFLYGEGGTGKSVLIDVLKTLVTQSNYSTIPMSLLDKSFLRAGLKDKILNFSTEESSSLVKDTVIAWIKAISSGDPIEAQFKMKDTFNFNPFCKLVFAVNDLPQIESFDEALKRRFIIIPFLKKFRCEEIDLELKEGKLHKELEGILQFALAGLKRLSEHKDFTYSEESKKQLDNYRLESNHAERFAETFIEQGSDGTFLKVKDVYKKYIDFCRQNNEKPFKNADFNKIVRRKFKLPEGRKQKRFKINNGYTVEDIFEGLTYKDFSKDESKIVPFKKSS